MWKKKLPPNKVEAKLGMDVTWLSLFVLASEILEAFPCAVPGFTGDKWTFGVCGWESGGEFVGLLSFIAFHQLYNWEGFPSDLYYHKILGLVSINYDLEDVVSIMLMNVLNDVGLIGMTEMP